MLESSMPDSNSILLCDCLIPLAMDTAKDDKGRPFWAFDRPFIGAGIVSSRFIRVKPGERPPVPHESYLDANGYPCVPGGVSVIEYRRPLCRYCRTQVPDDYVLGKSRCLNCGAQELEVEQVESLFFTIEQGYTPKARTL